MQPDPLPPVLFQPANSTNDQQQQQQLTCPRCNSTNTKFCYYNNYNLSQPRHFCKSCRRYWTKGGSLRNIPVGGGSRKNSKRSVSASSSYSDLAPKRPTRTASDPAPDPILKPEPVSAMYPDDKMLEISGSFSSLLQSSGQFGKLSFLDGIDSGGSSDVSGDPNRSDENPNPQPDNLSGWAGGWPDLAI